MAEKWDKQLMDILKRTGDELKRTGDDLKTQAQRLVLEVQDPSKQAKVKEGLENLRGWALTTSKQAAERIESAVRRVEESVGQAFDRQESAASSTPSPSPEASAPADASAPLDKDRVAARPATDDEETVDASQPDPVKKAPRPAKSIGPKKSKPVAKKAAAAGQPPSKSKPAPTKGGTKSIGRKKPARRTS